MCQSGYSFCDLTTKQRIEIIDDIVLANQDTFGKLTESEENIIQDRIDKKMKEGCVTDKDDDNDDNDDDNDDVEDSEEDIEVDSIMYKKEILLYCKGKRKTCL